MPSFFNYILQRQWLVHVLFISGLMLVTFATASFFRTLGQTQTNVGAIRHTYEVTLANNRIVLNVRSQEAYCRGYVIKKDTSLSNGFYRASEKSWMRCQELERLVADNPTQRINVATVKSVLREKQAVMDSMMDAADKNPLLVERLMTHSTALNPKLSERFSSISREEKRLMATRTSNFDRVTRLTTDWGYLSFGGAILFLLIGYVLSYTQSRGIRRINDELEVSNRELESKVADRTLDLQVQINLRNQELNRKNRELEEARRFQLSLIPTLQIPDERWEASAYIWPAEDVGGDYYDFKLNEQEDELLLALGDAAGHGLMAAMIVSNVHSYWHGFADREPADELLTRISSGLYALKLQMAIMAMAVIRIREGSLQLTAAAMPPFLLYHAQENKIEIITIRSMFLGSAISGGYEPQEYTFRKGDLLLAVSDGIIEARNTRGDFYGINRLKDSLNRYLNMPVRQITQAIYQDMQAFTGDRAQHDDVTVLAVRMRA